MRGQTIALAAVLLLPACASRVAAIDVRAACDQAFPDDEVKGAERRTVGELRAAYAVSYGPDWRGPEPAVLWADRSADTPAVRCLLLHDDGAVVEGEAPRKFARLGRAGQ